MRSSRVLPLAVAIVLLLPASALAKGMKSTSITGPGMTVSKIGGNGGSGTGVDPNLLAEGLGAYPAMFETSPDPMLLHRPEGDLGPRYTITYRIFGDGERGKTSAVTQDVYPYAPNGPVTFMEAGQDLGDLGRSRGGWFQAGDIDFDTLVSAGVPRHEPGAPSAAPPATSNAPAPTNYWPLVASVALALALGSALFRRFRPRSAHAS